MYRHRKPWEPMDHRGVVYVTPEHPAQPRRWVRSRGDGMRVEFIADYQGG